jgi:hypothetical protein
MQLLTFTNPTQILEIKNRLFLIDCEGTQVQLRKIKSDFLKLIIFLFRICTAITFWVDRSSVYFTLLNRNTDLHSWAKVLRKL